MPHYGKWAVDVDTGVQFINSLNFNDKVDAHITIHFGNQLVIKNYDYEKIAKTSKKQEIFSNILRTYENKIELMHFE